MKCYNNCVLREIKQPLTNIATGCSLSQAVNDVTFELLCFALRWVVSKRILKSQRIVQDTRQFFN